MGVYLDGSGIVTDGILKVPFLPESKAPVVVEVRLPRLQLDRHAEALDCLVVVALPVHADPLVVVSVRILGVDLDCLRVVHYSPVKVSNFVIGEAPVKESLEMVRHYFNCFGVEIDGLLVVPFFPGSVALRVEELGLLLLLLVVDGGVVGDGLGSLRDAHGARDPLTGLPHLLLLEVDRAVIRHPLLSKEGVLS